MPWNLFTLNRVFAAAYLRLMKHDLIFTSAAQVLAFSEGALPARIELMPTGALRLDDERGHVGQITDAAALIARSMTAAKGGVLPIDFGHGMDGLGGGDQRAAGWITALSVDGPRIMADVEWSSSGEAALKGREYRFISPTFTVSPSTKEASLILRAGLTNNPAFRELAKVASTQETKTMPKWLEQLAAKLGMPNEADEAKILAAAEGAIDQAGHAASIVTAAGLTGTLTETAATAISAKITASATPGTPDPAKYVPIQAVSELTAELASLRSEVQGDTAERLVTAAMSDGKVSPALKDWAVSYAKSDMPGFKTWLASTPVVLDGKAQTPTGEPVVIAGKLTAEEKAICAATNISEEAFLATKEGKSLTPKKAEG